eukprot:12904563-Heterocapsa_arctica.AAC.1
MASSSAGLSRSAQKPRRQGFNPSPQPAPWKWRAVARMRYAKLSRPRHSRQSYPEEHADDHLHSQATVRDFHGEFRGLCSRATVGAASAASSLDAGSATSSVAGAAASASGSSTVGAAAAASSAAGVAASASASSTVGVTDRHSY